MKFMIRPMNVVRVIRHYQPELMLFCQLYESRGGLFFISKTMFLYFQEKIIPAENVDIFLN